MPKAEVRAGRRPYSRVMKQSATFSSQLVGALAPAKLRKDGIRLGLVAFGSVIYSLFLSQPFLDGLLLGLNGLGILVSSLALIVALFTISKHARAALIASAVYGTLLAGHLVAIILLLG